MNIMNIRKNLLTNFSEMITLYPTKAYDETNEVEITSRDVQYRESGLMRTGSQQLGKWTTEGAVKRFFLVARNGEPPVILARIC